MFQDAVVNRTHKDSWQKGWIVLEFKKLDYCVRNRIAWITLNSPKNLNAFDERMDEEVIEALSRSEADDGVRAVVLSGVGKAFSAGGDIGAMYAAIKQGNADFSGEVRKIAGVSMSIKRLSKPVIAAVHGAVAGAAFNIALACDFCVASENASFMQAFVNIGLIPDAGGLFLLSRAVGVNKAMELAMTGRPVLAPEAEKLGFVCQVVPQEELEEAVAKLAGRLAAGPSVSYAELKRLMWEAQFQDMERYVAEEVKGQLRCGETADFKEGVSAFVEKRKPNYQ